MSFSWPDLGSQDMAAADFLKCRRQFPKRMVANEMDDL